MFFSLPPKSSKTSRKSFLYDLIIKLVTFTVFCVNSIYSHAGRKRSLQLVCKFIEIVAPQVFNRGPTVVH